MAYASRPRADYDIRARATAAFASRVTICVILAAAPGCAPDYDGVGSACHRDADCGGAQYCDWSAAHRCGRDASAGTCRTTHPGTGTLCPSVFEPVCGCDGKTYSNGCVANLAGASIDYGGPCRNDTAQVCGGFAGQTCSAPTPQQHKDCFVDPSQSNGPDSQGICLESAAPCTEACVSDSNTQACVELLNGGGRCVYTTGVSCAGQSDCGADALCMPLIGCSSASCPRVCVKP
jgi:hypothetical protein